MIALSSGYDDAAISEIRSHFTPLSGARHGGRLLDRVGNRRLVALGEASHGTHEFYAYRAQVTKSLIQQKGFTWVGVEGDWPDCWRLNEWVRGQDGQDLDARQLLSGFERWPTWMWANADVADFLDWLRSWNLSRPDRERVGFYGLDVYSLWDSLERIRTWLSVHAPEALDAAETAWRCFSPFGGDPQRYAWATRIVPQTCEPEVVRLLATVLRQTRADGAAAFDAMQNAEVAVGAERYYRAMVRGDRSSWNIRDIHMTDTIGRIANHLGAQSKGVIWEHNTHVGDARGTNMATEGLVNVGQLLRERYGPEHVCLIGFASHRGRVLAATHWGAREERMPVDEAITGSHEDLLHRAVGEAGILVWDPHVQGPWLRSWRGHRAIGVVFDPAQQVHNYVPTRMGRRYDALVWFEDTRSLEPLRHELKPDELEFETEPTGY
jgi:erythromycin esterase-like protein